ncbi:MAG: phosphoribosylamine--glycine ligase [Promethearchaeia archaeon]
MNKSKSNSSLIPDSLNRILIVGSWSKEQITIENIKQKKDLEVCAYLSTKNPEIISLVDDYTLGKFDDINGIVRFAQQKNVDLVLVTTAEPLKNGVINELEKNEIASFGPTKEAARLETDKAYTRRLMRRHNVGGAPTFEVFDNGEEATTFAEQLEWKVAVKPIGLTEGLGVKVYGDQLASPEEVKQYIHRVLVNNIGETSKVIIEERMKGEEFSIQCFVHENRVLPTPTVQDFKKLLPGGNGPNTASMGSYATTDFLLPFMQQRDFDIAMRIMRDTLEAYHSETGERTQGFLYGQFIITKNGIKLVEYNFRPGDPEWINTLSIMKNNVCDVIFKLLHGKKVELQFEAKATVCKYIVPPKYPQELYQTLEVSFDKEEIQQNGVNIYYSCGLDDQDRLNVGSERGISFIAKNNSIQNANKKVENAISKIEGNFKYRPDIGTKKLIEKKASKVSRLRPMKNPELNFRTVNESEYIKIHDFVEGIRILECYPVHVYRILFRYCANTCFVAEDSNNNIIAILWGIQSQKDEKTFFFWQIGVASEYQGMGIGTRLLDKLENHLQQYGLSRIEVTVDPENSPSHKLFEKAGYTNISSKEGKTIEVKGKTAIKDYYKPGRHFILYEKNLEES